MYNESCLGVGGGGEDAHLFDTAQCHCACAADGLKLNRQLTLKMSVCSQASKIRAFLKFQHLGLISKQRNTFLPLFTTNVTMVGTLLVVHLITEHSYFRCSN